MSTNMELITSVTVGSGGAASVTLPATGTIPQTYTDLYVLLSARSNRSADTDPVNLELNGSTANDTSRYIEGDGSSASSGTAGGTQTEIARIPAANATASTFGNASIYIPNYAGSNNKSSSGDAVTENNGTTAFTKLTAGLWSDTAAVTTIRLVSQTGNSFVEGSTFYLYGISNTIASGAKATGGYVSEDSSYWYHTFLSSGTFAPTQSLTADILVVAGGGGSQTDKGGGGGAGGVSYLTGASLTATSYVCTVGAGGGSNANGNNSVWNSSITSNGGGKGGTDNGGGRNGSAGGSGGGASRNGTVGSANQGNTGGATGYGSNGGAGSEGTPTNSFSGGGGGGAGQVGQAPTGTTGGVGGNGLNTWSSWAYATNTGDQGYYAGGGGGQPYIGTGSAFGAAGGLGGGGTGGNWYEGAGEYGSGMNGFVGTGGGAGGGGASGGSGLIIVRYAK